MGGAAKRDIIDYTQFQGIQFIGANYEHTYDGGLERGIQLTTLQFLPVDKVEEWLIHHVTQWTKRRAKTYAGVLFKELESRTGNMKDKFNFSTKKFYLVSGSHSLRQFDLRYLNY